MTVETQWVWISSEKTVTPLNGVPGAVTTVTLEVQAFNPLAPALFGSVEARVPLPAPDPQQFVPINEVTKAQMIAWAQEALMLIPEEIPGSFVDGEWTPTPGAGPTETNNMKAGYERRAISAFEQLTSEPLIPATEPFAPSE